MVPAPGQGCLAVQVRPEDRTTQSGRLRARSSPLASGARGGARPRAAPGRRLRPPARSVRGDEGRPDQDGGPRRQRRRGEGDQSGGREHGPRLAASTLAQRLRADGAERILAELQGPVKRTLAGRTILVTRPAEQAAPLVRELERRGARVLVAPTIRLIPARSAALTAGVEGAHRRAVRLDHAHERRDGRRAARPTRVTARRARDRSRRSATARRRRSVAGPAGIPTCSRRRSRPLRSRERSRAAPGRVLCARADIAPEGLEVALERKGWETVRVDAYRTVFATSLPREARDALRRGEVDAVTFTSASTVRGFVQRPRGREGHPEGRLHRPRHRRRGSGGRTATGRRRQAPHDRGRRRALERALSLSRPRPRATHAARCRRRPSRSARPRSRGRRASGSGSGTPTGSRSPRRTRRGSYSPTSPVSRLPAYRTCRPT